MHHTENCPRCGHTISEERRNMAPAVCDTCGFVISGAEKLAGAAVDKRSARVVIGFSVFVVLAFMQIVTWGGHSLEIIPLQVGNLTGAISVAQREHMATIALEVKKHDLVEQLYTDLALANPENYLRLGKFKMTRGKYEDAAKAFQRYFALGLDNLEGRYQYARALGEIGQVDEAAKHFELVLNARPGVRQVTVIGYYVKMLMHADRFEQARQVIEAARKNDSSAITFMDTEYKAIVARMSTNS